ncbi:hypothetical protein SAM19_03775 [Brevibacillus laterosporus]|nr:hypothetical protein [Brevibacillus laterosporus]
MGINRRLLGTENEGTQDGGRNLSFIEGAIYVPKEYNKLAEVDTNRDCLVGDRK